MTTVDVNLLGSIYSKDGPISHICGGHLTHTCPAAHLAIHFLELEREPDDTLKSIVMLGSMGRFRGCF